MRIDDHVICGFYAPETQQKRASWNEKHLSLVQTGKLIRFQLFNLKADPTQKSDLSKKDPDRFQKMKAQLIKAHTQMQSRAMGWEGTRPIKQWPK